MASYKIDERNFQAREYIQRHGLSLDNLGAEHLCASYHSNRIPLQIIADELSCAESTGVASKKAVLIFTFRRGRTLRAFNSISRPTLNQQII